jgi:Tfp pilus assembly protein PilW
MFKQFHFHLPRRARHGFSLVEMLIAVGASTIILASLMTVMLFSLRSFMAVGNYGELNQTSRYAMDVMNRDVRGAAAITAFASDGSSMTLTNSDKSTVRYVWDSSATTVTRTFTAGTYSTSRVMLTNCDSFVLGVYKGTPTSGTGGPVFAGATNALTQGKVINVSWTCSRTIRGAKQNTESVQSAQITMRN